MQAAQLGRQVGHLISNGALKDFTAFDMGLMEEVLRIEVFCKWSVELEQEQRN